MPLYQNLADRLPLSPPAVSNSRGQWGQWGRLNGVNGVDDPQLHACFPHLPPSPPLSIEGADLAEISRKEICPLGSNLNGARIPEEYTKGQHTGLARRESTLKNYIAGIKPNIATDDPLWRQLPPSPPESVREEVEFYYALED
ncbi:hypothetical protein V498_06544 [Pseudogymnoascus sp. VKM F-4517 (FW-2822)]|nr:hypothetical protein V498_06544 [Pseudogymnoascus sp. VKM F-4517 (FW-2822)]